MMNIYIYHYKKHKWSLWSQNIMFVGILLINLPNIRKTLLIGCNHCMEAQKEIQHFQLSQKQVYYNFARKLFLTQKHQRYLWQQLLC